MQYSTTPENILDMSKIGNKSSMYSLSKTRCRAKTIVRFYIMVT